MGEVEFPERPGWADLPSEELYKPRPLEADEWLVDQYFDFIMRDKVLVTLIHNKDEEAVAMLLKTLEPPMSHSEAVKYYLSQWVEIRERFRASLSLPNIYIVDRYFAEIFELAEGGRTPLEKLLGQNQAEKVVLKEDESSLCLSVAGETFTCGDSPSIRELHDHLNIVLQVRSVILPSGIPDMFILNLDEAFWSLKTGAYRSAIALARSVLEIVLDRKLTEMGVIVGSSGTSAPRAVGQATLGYICLEQLIDDAKKYGLFFEGFAKKAHALRAFANLVMHPVDVKMPDGDDIADKVSKLLRDLALIIMHVYRSEAKRSKGRN
jgi:hypothetical protein